MNRHSRRKAAAIERQRAADLAPLAPARMDGRPLYFDISEADRVVCHTCETRGIKGITHGRRKAFMNDPANSPAGDKGVYTICQAHLPDNAVIYDPTTNLCRDKSGQNEWMEDKPVDTTADDFTA